MQFCVLILTTSQFRQVYISDEKVFLFLKFIRGFRGSLQLSYLKLLKKTVLKIND